MSCVEKSCSENEINHRTYLQCVVEIWIHFWPIYAENKAIHTTEEEKRTTLACLLLILCHDDGLIQIEIDKSMSTMALGSFHFIH